MKTHTALLLPIVVIVLTVCGCARQTPTPAATPVNAPTTANTQQSVQAFIDPATGELREPTADEQRALAEKARVDRSKITSDRTQPRQTHQEVRQSDGSIEVVLDPNAQQPLIACIDKSGAVGVDHDCGGQRP